MMTLALLLLLTVLSTGGAVAAPSGDAGRLMEDATAMLLEGREMPRDIRVRLLALQPAERIRVIAYLRRIGMMTGAAWPATDLLLAPPGPQENPE